MTTVQALLTQGAGTLRRAGIEAPRHEARLILAHVLGLPREAVFARPDRAVAPADGDAFEGLVARRAGGEPMSHLRGRREFWGLSFRAGPAVLDPRPDSETVVALALDLLGDRARPWRILDLGTGSGCLLLALLSELPAAQGIGVDRSVAALSLAAASARDLGLADRAALFACDWDTAIAGRFDLVVSNPPYIPRAEIADLQPEVARHEPRLALDGGPDGLDAYRRLAPALPGLLAPGGAAVLELGAGQAPAVSGLLAAAGFCEIVERRDLAGTVRALGAFRGRPK